MSFQRNAFLTGYLSKFASEDEGLGINPINAVVGTGAHTGAWAVNKALWLAALAPVLGGMSAGALSSKFTSPATEKDVVQKSLIAAELEEAVAELKRKRAVDLKKKEYENGGTERSLHI